MAHGIPSEGPSSIEHRVHVLPMRFDQKSFNGASFCPSFDTRLLLPIEALVCDRPGMVKVDYSNRSIARNEPMSQLHIVVEHAGLVECGVMLDDRRPRHRDRSAWSITSETGQKNLERRPRRIYQEQLADPAERGNAQEKKKGSEDCRDEGWRWEICVRR